jgi:ABC-2 type transport system ATP-binding protein
VRAGDPAPVAVSTVRAVEPALVLSGLRKVYPGSPSIEAVRGVDLTVAEGEMFGLLGPNGAGKSTTVGMCTTRIRPSAGTVTITGLDAVGDAARVKRRIGVVTQDNTLDRALTVWENLYHHGLYFGWSTRRSRARADELLERFRLTDRATAFPAQISGGMAQRLQVARAVAHEPRLLFLDEPTAGLDPQSRLALWELVQQLRGDGLTVVLTTHYIEEADQLCDRVAIIDHGQVLVCDTPQRLKEEHGAGALVELVLEREPDAAVLARLRAVEGVLSIEPAPALGSGGLRVIASGSDGLLVRLVTAAEAFGVRDVGHSGSTLEAVFINLTGRDLRE